MSEQKDKTNRFATPKFSELPNKQQIAVKTYLETLDKIVAVKAADYTEGRGRTYQQIADKLFADPKVVAAIDELSEHMLAEINDGKAALCIKLLHQSLATIWDVCELIPYKNGNGTVVEGKQMLFPKPLDKIEPRFLCAVNFIKRNTDGSYGWDNIAQHRASQLLASLTMWDQQQLDVSPALTFIMPGIQEQPYERPKHGIDTSSLKSGGDEVDKLTH